MALNIAAGALDARPRQARRAGFGEGELHELLVEQIPEKEKRDLGVSEFAFGARSLTRS